MDFSTSSLFDTHVHLDLLADGMAPGKAAAAAREAGVGGFLLPGVRRGGWDRLLATAVAVDGARAAPGLHPLAAGEWNGAAESELRTLIARPEVAAIGEIGLDGLLAEPSAAVQEEAFRGQLRLAVTAGLPVLIHCRRATERLFTILREERAEQVGGILHAFSGSIETARRGIELGFVIGFGGTLTYPNARRAPEVLKAIPAESIVLETDSPDIPPHPHRGEANRPEWLPLIARKVAEIRGWSPEETARITTGNARRVLNIW